MCDSTPFFSSFVLFHGSCCTQTRKCKPGRDYYRLTTTLKLPIKWMALGELLMVAVVPVVVRGGSLRV